MVNNGLERFKVLGTHRLLNSFACLDFLIRPKHTNDRMTRLHFVSLLVFLCMWLSFLLKHIDKFDLMKIIGSLIKDNTLSIVYFVTHGLIKSATQYSLFILYLV